MSCPDNSLEDLDRNYLVLSNIHHRVHKVGVLRKHNCSQVLGKIESGSDIDFCFGTCPDFSVRFLVLFQLIESNWNRILMGMMTGVELMDWIRQFDPQSQ